MQREMDQSSGPFSQEGWLERGGGFEAVEILY